MTLYEISAQYSQLASMDMETDEDVAAFVSLLAEIDDSFDAKAENYCRLIANLEADSEGFTAEIKRMDARRKAINGKIDRLKNALEIAFKEASPDGKARRVGLFSLAMKKNPPKVSIFGEVPDEYTKSEPDVNKIKSALKNGIVISGAELIQESRLSIS